MTKLNQKASYSSVVVNSDRTTHEGYSDFQAVALLCMNPKQNSKNIKDSNITAVPRVFCMSTGLLSQGRRVYCHLIKECGIH